MSSSNVPQRKHGFLHHILLSMSRWAKNRLGPKPNPESPPSTPIPLRQQLIDAQVFRFNTPPQIEFKQLLLERGYLMSRRTRTVELRDLIRRLQPVVPEEGLIRVGGEGDGGYLIPDNLSGIYACFSPGVAESAQFEEELHERCGAIAFLADYSVEQAPVRGLSYQFLKKFLGTRNDEIYMRLDDWIATSLPESQEDFILQMDIEGAEYRVLLDTPRSTLQRFRIIVIEFHGLDQLFNADAFPWLQQVFDHLLEDFAVVHLHPNNCQPAWLADEIQIPGVMEITLYRRDMLKPSSKPVIYPHPLDRTNIPALPDIKLAPCWGVAYRD